MYKKRVLCFMLAVLLILPALAACGGDAGGGNASFTWWIIQGADASYYAAYEDNPAVRYMLSKTYNGSKISLNFMVPVAGSEQDNFNTLLATGEYADIMVTTQYQGSIEELYREGIILDLTEYIDKWMPNYKALLESDPEAYMYAAHIVDGERKNLILLEFGDIVADTWCGYQYRRDWIVKYGKNPFDGSGFSGSYDSDGEWTDNVIFPNGGTYPIYISDWEWMLNIFAAAIADLGISDGYPISIGYGGYFGTGDIFTGFGGGGPTWHIDPNNQIQFGGTSANMRAYLQCMNTWFERGWIDRAFAERSADMFYRIDDAGVRQGKVGMWIGIQSQLGSGLDSDMGFAEGMVSFAARQPINDLYGGSEVQGKTPYSMYQISRIGGSLTITSKAAEKDLETLFTFLDSLYTKEGGLLIQRGLSKEQVDETQDEFYLRHGLTEGGYRPVETESGTKYEITDEIYNDLGTLAQAAAALRLGTGWVPQSLLQPRGSGNFLQSLDEWIVYKSTGFMQPSFTAMLASEDARLYARGNTQVTEFLEQNLPLFVRGQRNPFDDTDWNNYVDALERYNPGRVTVLFQNLLSTLAGK
ncbi:MAG: hypothetical protein FWG36_03275 [Oscillospiraceae bacterium]|nr:hypothetical protein [Oscillospiraceae bacterium]